MIQITPKPLFRVFSGTNFKEIPKHLSSIRNTDWRVAVCFAAAVIAIVAVAHKYLRPVEKGTKPPTPNLKPPTSQPKTEPATPAASTEPKPSLQIKDLTPSHLFTADELDEKITTSLFNIDKARSMTWSLNEICECILRELRGPSQKEITFNRVDSAHILDYLQFGLSQNISFIYANDQLKCQSWVVRTLNALREQGYISEFIITEDTSIKIQLN